MLVSRKTAKISAVVLAVAAVFGAAPHMALGQQGGGGHDHGGGNPGPGLFPSGATKSAAPTGSSAVT
jgi:hypothetical protein